MFRSMVGMLQSAAVLLWLSLWCCEAQFQRASCCGQSIQRPCCLWCGLTRVSTIQRLLSVAPSELIALQVAHLHALGVMHRDIKPENFLLTDETDAANLKVPGVA